MTVEAPIRHPASWPVRRLAEVTRKIGSGSTPTGGEASYLPSRLRYALVRSQNVFDHQFDPDGLAFISDEQAARLRGVELELGDVLLNITGDGVTFGRACLVSPEMLPACVNQHVSIVRADPTVLEPGYLLGFLTHPAVKTYVESFNAGGSRRAITKGHIESFCIPLPPLPLQRAIAAIVNALNDKIHLNRRMAETLSELARAIFKSWFVDFDPVRAKAHGRHLVGIDAETAALFPSKLVVSQVGEIPEGWHIAPLKELAEVIMGASPPGSSYNDDGIGTPLINGPSEYGDYFVKRVKWTTEPTQLSRDGDLIFCVRGSTTGRRAIADGEYCLGRGVCAIRGTSAPQTYVDLAVDAGLSALLAHATGSVFPNLSRDSIRAAQCVVGTDQILDAFDTAVSPLVQRVRLAWRESETLAEVRDLLVPRLVSGELQAMTAEKMIEAAL